MRRLRLLRLLLLALLVPFVVVVVLMFRNPNLGTPDFLPTSQSGETGTDVRVEDWVQGVRRLLLKADSVQMDDDGEVRFENIERVEVHRDGESPLVISATRGSLTGAEGQRLVRLEGGVQVEDQYEELVVELNALEVNQAAGEARSIGEVRFEAPRYSGSARSVIYGLDDQPSVIHDPVMEAEDGSVIRAERATLDGPAGPLLR